MIKNPLPVSSFVDLKTTLRAVMALALVASCSYARALPIVLSYAEFSTATSGLPIIVENIQGIAFGEHPDPLTIANGVFSPAAFVDAGNLFCGKPLPDRCLLASDSITDTRTFSSLPLGTNYWGADLYYGDPTDVFDIIVVGGSGTLSISKAASSSFFGFYDMLGITTVSFANIRSGPSDGSVTNYSFDNITTASGVNVPAPSTFPMLAIGLIGLGVSRRKLVERYLL